MISIFRVCGRKLCEALLLSRRFLVIGGGLDVDLIAGEPGGQAGILPLLRATARVAPTEGCKRCGEVRNPPVTASPCQPPLGKGAEGTGDADCHGRGAPSQ